MRHEACGELYRSGTSSANPFRMFPDDTAARKDIGEIMGPEGWCCPHCGTDNGMPSEARP